MFPVGSSLLPVQERWNCVVQRSLSGLSEMCVLMHINTTLCVIAGCALKQVCRWAGSGTPLAYCVATAHRCAHRTRILRKCWLI